MAALLWYGLEIVRRNRQGGRSMKTPHSDDQAETDLGERISTLLIEARVILPGAQALLGFQFTAFLTDGFAQMPNHAKLVHFACLACVALTAILLMAPAAYHRLVAEGEDRPDVERFGNRVVLGSLLPLALGLSGEFYIVAGKVGYPDGPAIAATLIAFSVFVGLWFVYPLLVRASAKSARHALSPHRE
jgi:hypothetical protein